MFVMDKHVFGQVFKHVFEQTRPKSRNALAFLESFSDTEIESNFSPSKHNCKFDCIWEIYQDQYVNEYPGLETSLEDLTRDLWAILIAKSGSKSDADDKTKGVAQGEGFWAYLRVHKWFNQTIEQGMINR